MIIATKITVYGPFRGLLVAFAFMSCQNQEFVIKDVASREGFEVHYSLPVKAGKSALVDTRRPVTCYDSVLEFGSLRTYRYRLSGDSLFWDRQEGGPDSSQRVETFEIYVAKNRDGDSVQGLWRFVGHGYRLLGDSLSPQNRSILQTSLAQADSGLADLGIRLDIGVDTVWILGEKPYSEWMLRYLESEWLPLYELTLVADGKRTIAISGLRTGEILHYAIDAEGNNYWTSNASAHGSWRQNPFSTTCPNPPRPAWISEFLSANLRLSKK